MTSHITEFRGVNGSTCSRASSGTRAIGSSRHQRHCRSEGNEVNQAIIIWGGSKKMEVPQKKGLFNGDLMVFNGDLMMINGV